MQKRFETNISIYKYLLEEINKNSNKYKNDIEDLKDYLIYKSKDIDLLEFCETFFKKKDYKKYFSEYKSDMDEKDKIMDDLYSLTQNSKIERKIINERKEKEKRISKRTVDLMNETGITDESIYKYISFHLEDIKNYHSLLMNNTQVNKYKDFIKENASIGVLDKSLKTERYKLYNEIIKMNEISQDLFSISILNEDGFNEFHRKLNVLIENKSLISDYYHNNYITNLFPDIEVFSFNEILEVRNKLKNFHSYKYKKEVIASIVDDLSSNKEIFDNVLLSRKLNSPQYYKLLELTNKNIEIFIESIVSDNMYIKSLHEDEYYELYPLLDMYFEEKNEELESLFRKLENGTLNKDFSFQRLDLKNFINNIYGMREDDSYDPYHMNR